MRSEIYVLHDLLIYEPCIPWTPCTCCFNLFDNVVIIKHDEIGCSITKYIAQGYYENGALIGSFFVAPTHISLSILAKL